MVFDPPKASEDGQAVIERLQSWMRGTGVFVLGSGASANYGYPLMGALAAHLQQTVAPPSGTEEQWAAICNTLIDGTDLESALTQIHCSDELINQIVARTWDHVTCYDLEFYRRLTEDGADFPLAHLIKSFETSKRSIDLVTTNYDRVLEYACDLAGITWLDGTGFGYFRRGMSSMGIVLGEPSKAPRPTVARIWKVHGSLDWFSGEDGTFTARALRSEIPARTRPLIVTPGQAKYERAFEDPFRSILSGADAVLKAANSFLCLGYGFNDKHVHAKLLEKARDPQARFVVAARTLTEGAKRFLLNGACKNFIAIEKAVVDDQSIIWVTNRQDPVTVSGELWSVAGLLATIN